MIDADFWDTLAAEFQKLTESGQPLSADWNAIVSDKEGGQWLLRPEIEENETLRTRFEYLAARAVMALGIPPSEIPDPRRHCPSWDDQLKRRGIIDAVAAGIQPEQRHLRAWLEFLRNKSKLFKQSTDKVVFEGGTLETVSGEIKDVCLASVNECVREGQHALLFPSAQHPEPELESIPLYRLREKASEKVSPPASSPGRGEFEYKPTTDGPQISFLRWGDIPGDHEVAIKIRGEVLQRGFHLFNDGRTAHEIEIESFELESMEAKCSPIARIGEAEKAFAFVWLEGYSLFSNKWDLLAAMSRASDEKFGNSTYRPDYTVSIVANYRDGAQRRYRSRADLKFIRSQGRLEFGATIHERAEPPEDSSSPVAANKNGSSADVVNLSASDMTTTVDQRPGPASRKRGRPAKIDPARKDAALAARARSESWSEVAKILYNARYPTKQQVKNASNILKQYVASKSSQKPPNKSLNI